MVPMPFRPAAFKIILHIFDIHTAPKNWKIAECFVFNMTNHPMTTTGYPHLLIDGAIQFQHIQQQLQRAATVGEYKKYLQTKCLWTDNQYDSIQWTAFQQAYQ